MSAPVVRIVSNGLNSNNVKITVNGETLTNVTAATWTARGGTATTCTLELVGVEVDVEGELTDPDISDIATNG